MPKTLTNTKKKTSKAAAHPPKSKAAKAPRKSVRAESISKPTKTLTRIIVRCNCGFGNQLYIRGHGVGLLTWDKGIQLRNIDADRWVWETASRFDKAEFKLLINDRQYEIGENHSLTYGAEIDFSPQF